MYDLKLKKFDQNLLIIYLFIIDYTDYIDYKTNLFFLFAV